MRVKRTDMFVTPVWEVDLGFDNQFIQTLLSDAQQYYKDTNVDRKSTRLNSSH